MSDEMRDYEINKIFEIVMAFNNESNYMKLLDIILEKMMELTDSDAGTLYTVEDGALFFRIVRNNSLNIFKTDEDETDLPPIFLDEQNIDSISAYSAIKNEVVVVDDVYASDRFNFSGPKDYDKLTGYRTGSMLVLPLTTSLYERAEVIGIIQLMNATDRGSGEFISYDKIYNPPVMLALSNIAANTLANITHVRDIRMLFNSFVAVMTQAIDERSSYNNNHTQNVSAYCEAFATFLSGIYPSTHPFYFDERRKERLTMAALLHDIGKIITPLYIMDKADRLGYRLEPLLYKFEIKKLQVEMGWMKGKTDRAEYESEINRVVDAETMIVTANAAGYIADDTILKLRSLASMTYDNMKGEPVPLFTEDDIDALTIQKGTLTNGERMIMQEHVSLTGRLLDKIIFWKYYEDVPKWARSHHELLDGTGYPLKLKGSELSVEMCIITIMDIFEALTATDRPYKRAMPMEKALEELELMAEAGKLHKDIVELFIASRIYAQ